MLQQAYLARQNSENSFYSFDERVAEFQKTLPTALYCRLTFGKPCKREDLIGIALHFASMGYDVYCQNDSFLLVNWEVAEEGRTGKIHINNRFCYYTQDASYQDK